MLRVRVKSGGWRNPDRYTVNTWTSDEVVYSHEFGGFWCTL